MVKLITWWTVNGLKRHRNESVREMVMIRYRQGVQTDS